MSLEVGTRLGHYAVTALIGEGGMGQVWQATDTQLGREVALKILPDAFAADPDRLARFTREAQILASLNHPNIAAIHGVEESPSTHSTGSGSTPSGVEGTTDSGPFDSAQGKQGAVRALVLELVEGPTLADRISEGPIPLDDALPIARQIAEALEAAHEAGVIHRDLKPANIKVKDDGTVEVLDFGLAKAFQPDASDPSMSLSPTISLTAAATQMGMIIGTAAYMSPEQAKGKVVDKRADVWAFGAVLFEMLTGKKTFAGDDVTETLAAVVRADPDWSALPADVPARVGQVLRACLQKSLRDRARDIGDVSLAMRGTFETTVSAASDPAVVAGRASSLLRLAPWALAIAFAAIAVALWVCGSGPTDTGRTAYLELALPTATSETGGWVNFIDISAEGRHIVVDTGNGPFTLYDLDQSGGGVAIAGTEGAAQPLLSPDGSSIAYVANNVLQRRLLSGGNPDLITTPKDAQLFGASWAPDDRILFVPGWQTNVLAVSAAPGSAPESLIEIDPGTDEVAHAEPQLLPDGRILYSGWDDNWFIAVADPETGDREVLFHNGHAGHYVPTGHLVYAQDHYLFARTFDLDTLELGDPVQILDNLNFAAGPGRANFAISDNGVLAYLTGPDEIERTMVKIWTDGRREPLTDTRRRYAQPLRVSPDGRQLVMNIFDAVGGYEVWVYDIARDDFQAIAQDDGWDEFPIWSADGRSVVRTTETLGAADLLIRPADASAPSQPLFADERLKYAVAAHPSGKYLVQAPYNEQNMTDLWVYADNDPDDPEHFLPVPGNQEAGAFSPDGRHIAYDSEEFGVSEVYARPYPRREEGADWFRRISRDGGREPRWVVSDRIVYRQGTRAMEVRVTDNGSELTFSDPVQLFDGLDVAWDISPDGTYFVSLELIEPPRLMVVLDWFEELKRLAPVP